MGMEREAKEQQGTDVLVKEPSWKGQAKTVKSLGVDNPNAVSSFK